MCLLTAFPMPELLDKAMQERLLNGCEANPHGNGWAVVTANGIEVGKAFDAATSVDQFSKLYDRAIGPAIFHSRWATHGEKTLDNVHPFLARGISDTYIAHNGILPQDAWPELQDDRSDTRVFADDIFPVRYKRLDRAKVRAQLNHWLHGNKIAVLTTNPRYSRQLYVFGMSQGHWVDGAWFSNSDYESWTKYYNRHFGEGLAVESCVMCGSKAVNNWAICTGCGTCQDCYEHQDACQCFYSSSTSVLDDDDDRPDTLDQLRANAGTPLALEGRVEKLPAFPTVIGYDPKTGREYAGSDSEVIAHISDVVDAKLELQGLEHDTALREELIADALADLSAIEHDEAQAVNGYPVGQVEPVRMCAPTQIRPNEHRMAAASG